MTVVATPSGRPASGHTGLPRWPTATFWSIGIIALGLAAWIAALILMADMDQGPGTPLHDFPTYLVGWIIMLTAMMLPSEILYVRVYAALLDDRTRTSGTRFASMAAFISGYGLAWIAYGIIAFLLDAAIRQIADDRITWSQGGPTLAGSVMVAAGIYQISNVKQACLSHCRTPLSFFARHWRAGPLGSLHMGLRHGLVCVGCCWALMAVMFAVGAMSLIWMGLLTLVMFAEKVLPRGNRLALPIAVILWAMGVWIAVSPDTAPFLKDLLLYGSIICRTS